MSYQFLCPRHREWLTRHPEQVSSFWRSAMDAAQQAVSGGHWYKALPHAGCAFEAARLMVGDATSCNREWVSRHRASEALLRLVNAGLQKQPAPVRPTAASGRPVTLH